MLGFSLRVGLDFKLDGENVQIERIQPNCQIMLQRKEDGQLLLSDQKALLTAYAEGRLVIEAPTINKDESQQQAQYGRPLAELPINIQSELSRRKQYIQWLEEMESFVFTAAFMDPLIAQVAQKLGDPKPPCTRTLKRWYDCYRKAKDFRAIVPRYDLRGSGNLRQDERLLELVAESIEAAYKVTPAANMKSIEAHLAGKLKQENHHRLAEDQLTMPSRRTMYRIFDRLEAYEKFMLKKGKAEADRRFRISKQGPIVDFILERVEIDHTPLDLFILDEKTWLPLGRPTLTVAIDCHSRMVLGYYLSFGGASTAAVMGVLRHAILPKKLSDPEIPGLDVLHEWPCYGLFDVAVMDNGPEFHSLDLDSVASDLLIELRFCPKRTPRFKGRIERFLKTINYSFCHQLPGTSLAKFAERGDYDPLKHALLTLGELKHAVEKWILDVYSQDRHRMIETTPWNKWQQGMQRKSPTLPQSASALQQRIGLVAERKLRHDGIWLNSIRYASDALLPTLCAYGEGVSVRIVFDPENLGNIHVWPPEHESPLIIPAAHFEYANGLTTVQHNILRKILLDDGKKAEDLPALMAARQQLTEALENLMNSRKQGKRKNAARINGKTSEDPNRVFDSKQPVEPKAPSEQIEKKASLINNNPPKSLPFFSDNMLDLNSGE